MRREENFLLSTRSITRHVYSPMLNRSGGVISHYDNHFQRYAPLARWDWRLLAAQCYQESTFDPEAGSWAGARGLMQIMPSTAAHLGLSMDEIHDPEKNIAAAAKYIQELNGHFQDVPGSERVKYVLASYNGGYFHIRDAMALARKHGRNAYSWNDVSEFVLKLSDPAYYRDPVVRYGYMRGSETADYVGRIMDRWRSTGVWQREAHRAFPPSQNVPSVSTSGIFEHRLADCNLLFCQLTIKKSPPSAIMPKVEIHHLLYIP
jgi:membrane-bound lytic murein transglycosylase F